MMIKRAGFDIALTLPSTRFHRTIGSWANIPTDPTGKVVNQSEFDNGIPSWLPTEEDRAFIKSLMQRVVEPGKMAGWIAPPDRGINNNPVDYEYVRLK
jgi:benzoyl-CoA 2,3-dioxygenase component B